MLKSTFHIEADGGRIVGVKIMYYNPSIAQFNNVEVRLLSPCHYKGNYRDVGDSIMIPPDDLCDIEFDENGIPIIDNLLPDLYCFIDDSKIGKKVICKIFAGEHTAGEEYHMVKIFTSCEKHGGEHSRRHFIYVKKDELEKVTYRLVQRGDLRKKAVKVIDQ